MPNTLFDKIMRGEIESRIVWEDKKHIAFLTPFPKTNLSTMYLHLKDYEKR